LVRTKATILCLTMIMLFLSSCSNEQSDRRTKILDVRTDLTKDSNWWVVPEDVAKMTIYVEAEHTDIVLFWLAPTGTGTGKERTLIGYDVDGSDGWSYTWEFGDRTFHDHIHIQALGSDDSTLASHTINVHSP